MLADRVAELGQSRNKENSKALIEWQRTSKTGCFFIALYMAEEYYGHDLPDAKTYLNSIEQCYGYVLREGTLHVQHDYLGYALKIYEQQGLSVVNFTINNQARGRLGTGIYTIDIPITDTKNNDPLPTQRLAIPHCRWVGQNGADSSHFVTDDGSKEARSLIEDYEQEGFKPIATFEVIPLT